jgi:hypothetical protein
MDNPLRTMIDDEYKRICSELERGRLYGLPVDMEDPKMVAVAAYRMGRRLDETIGPALSEAGL